MAKAAFWTVTDAEARKRGERTGLDTLVVHAVNDCLLYTSVRYDELATMFFAAFLVTPFPVMP